MLEKNQKQDNFVKNEEKDSNLVDFFNLLLKIDKRNNPHLYGLEKNNKYD